MPRKGANTYPVGWFDLAERVKLEAGNRCACCGHHHDPAAGYSMTVHHFDMDRGNSERWNLMPLCQRCHLRVQAQVDVRDGLVVAPRPWAMPYFAGAIACGRAPTPPAFDLASWAAEYEANTGKAWPAWAPAPEIGVSPCNA